MQHAGRIGETAVRTGGAEDACQSALALSALSCSSACSTACGWNDRIEGAKRIDEDRSDGSVQTHPPCPSAYPSRPSLQVRDVV